MENTWIFILLAALTTVSAGFLGDSGGDATSSDGFDGTGVIEPRSANAGADEDSAALSAVGLSRLLGGGLGGGYGGANSGATYTISGPTQEIKSVHRITTTNAGGQVLSRQGGSGAGSAKILLIKASNNGHQSGWQ